MSCFLITYQDGHKVARPVTSREEYLALRDSKEQIQNLAKARRGNDAAKRRLVQMNYSCMPNADGTLKGAKQMTTTVGMDVDGLKPEQLDDIAAKIIAKKQSLGLLMLEKSARLHGFHLVFRRRQNLSQEENLRWASELLGVEYDSGAKDITRIFFTTTKDDLLFLDDELFSVSPTHEPEQKKEKPKVTQEKAVVPASSAPADAEYDEATYAAIVHELEKLLGGVPMHGSRNQFIFTMACNLRYICNHDPQWVAKVLPDYGENREKWYNSIKSACNRSMTIHMPKVMKRAIERVKMAQAKPCDDAEGTDGSGNGSIPPRMPKTLPAMIRLLVSKTPDIYQPAVAHAVFPALATHLWHTKFRYIDNVEHEATLMCVLMAGTGAGKSCITKPIDCIMKDVRERDKISMEKEQEWKDEMNTKGANKDKKNRPEGIVIQEVDADMTNAAFVLRMAEAEDHFLYVRMNEIEQFNALKVSARSDSHFQIMCLAFDPGNSYGQTRVGVQSVSRRVCIRFNWNASTTIRKGQQYFSKVLTDGPISRINFCTIPEQEIGADMPIYGTYDEQFDKRLKPYIDNLNAARGVIECPQAFELAKKLKEENADFARLSQSRTFENLSFRANVIAYLKAMVLYVANGCKWERSFEDFIRWSERYDLWCKMHFFGDAIDNANGEVQVNKRGPRNLLEELPDTFTYDDVVEVRRQQNLSADKTRYMLNNWKTRGYIVRDPKGQKDVWVKCKGKTHRNQ